MPASTDNKPFQSRDLILSDFLGQFKKDVLFELA